MANIFTGEHHFDIFRECDVPVLNQIKQQVTKRWISNPKKNGKQFYW